MQQINFLFLTKKYSPILLAMFIVLFLANCKKDNNGSLSAVSFTGNESYFKNDTLTFDTVFTSLGSTTRSFKIKNNQNQPLVIDQIKLMALQGNQYRINVDGINGTNFYEVEIGAKDSIYVFVEVTVNPNTATAPLVITDEIQVIDNGQTKSVFLQAWGQDAYYHFGDSIASTIVWPNDKPHIVLNIFPIKTTGSLTLQPRTRVYMGPNALITCDGQFTINGGANGDSVVFQGIRLEHSFDNKPGQWLGIVYGRSSQINFNYAIINESYFGLSDEHVVNVLVNDHVTTSFLATYSTANAPDVNLNQCIIRNAASSAITALYSNVVATNCLFHSCGGQMIVLAYGGNYLLRHCTLANSYNVSTTHKTPTLTISDAILDLDETANSANTTVTVENSIIYGTLQNELTRIENNNLLTTQFSNSLLKMPADSFRVFQTNLSGCIFNDDPKFKDVSKQDYSPAVATAPQVNTGLNLGVLIDLYGKSRNAQPDMGAIEW